MNQRGQNMKCYFGVSVCARGFLQCGFNCPLAPPTKTLVLSQSHPDRVSLCSLCHTVHMCGKESSRKIYRTLIPQPGSQREKTSYDLRDAI